jgi:hypothetical protein
MSHVEIGALVAPQARNNPACYHFLYMNNEEHVRLLTLSTKASFRRLK